jgi:ribulose-5-phosphate 4-epimerase/fuculose-1-phosphate aldolase
MKVGDKCKYMDYNSNMWKDGIIQSVQGPVSARVYIVTGSGQFAGELETRTDHYIMKADK